MSASVNLLSGNSHSAALRTPRQVYVERLDQTQKCLNETEAADRRYAASRGVVGLLTLALCWFVFAAQSVNGWWLLLPVATFAVLVVFHDGVIRQRERLKRVRDHYQLAIKRLDGKWAGAGAAGERYAEPDHAYSSDLNLFGHGSMFQLMCGVRTRPGEDALARWLCRAATPEAIRQRQAAVDELREQVDLREQLAVLDAEVADGFDQNQLVEWSSETERRITPGQRVLFGVLGIAAAGTLIAWIAGFGHKPFVVVIIVELLAYGGILKHLRQTASDADRAGSGLFILSQVLKLLETQHFHAPLLARLRGSLDTDGRPPSWQIARLRNRIQHLNNCLKNQFVGLFSFPLGLPVQFAWSIERWRAEVGPDVREWLDAVGRIEALTSISRYAYEHPDHVFPEFVDPANGPRFDAKSLGHPLLPDDACVANDVKLSPDRRLLIVSGSNMSGKSTLLRTIGLNAALAQCGAPVRAERLSLSPLQVGTAMQFNDSLMSGASLFYQVISRTRAIVDLSGKSPPLLFLLDEILQGTNSHDRRVGAEGIIRQLVHRGAIGLVTTHDLALTEIVHSFNGQADNVHLEDHLIDGKMTFDYKVRPGVVRKSNALELMRMIGLDVAVKQPADSA